MSQDELEIESADQTKLFVRRFQPDGTPKARLLWLHGFAEHSGRYVESLQWFAQHGFESWMLDFRGHGQSGGKQVYIDRFSQYLDDAEALYRHVGSSESIPTFWIAHSMGGLVLARFLQERKNCRKGIGGAVILSPFLRAKIQLPKWKTVAGRLLSAVLPSFSLPVDSLPDLLSKDPTVGRAYIEDPLIPKKATARWFTETMKAQELALVKAPEIDLPLLVMHGRDDGLADNNGTIDFFENTDRKEKELRFWDGLRHELLNEVEKDEVREYIREWLDGRVRFVAVAGNPN